ncbi:mobile mystery protein B [Constantimarinum furrinae]|uniref:Fic family protein n=1 Tax=Constantimarinum furrinae TaxID=2562285 RepID=A0A7G8PRR9_9FLAO|nr:mobile mystery protein B [Constantimarinum furrinae]QNJ97035.1 Fic family protein [Constantimarinum furrinae]
MGLDLEYQDGQTTLEEEEKEGLKIPTVTSHKELNEHEQLNIQNALEWVVTKKFKVNQVLSENFIKLLHKRMYGDVWKWAGKFRQSEKNIGVKWIQIGIALRTLLDDTKLWIEEGTFPPDEIAIRFKHRLVSIHCFPNGNGRHSRLMADILIERILGQPRFSWGNSNLVEASETRSNYIQALKEADVNNFEPLIAFARS